MKQRFLSIFLVLALIIPFFPQVTLPAKAAETTAKTQDENSNDRDHKEGSIGSITDGTRTGKKEEGNKNGFTIMERAKGRSAMWLFLATGLEESVWSFILQIKTETE